MSFTQVREGLGFKDIHIERTKDVHKAIAYCQKVKSRISGPYFFGDVPKHEEKIVKKI